ncbi:hypothetical protein [uncultured Veillonella sp.]|uniref:hypothetical protein n=1 Tax=uncultured Veillonella sp. TaxID=159268 RepID=UPI0025E293B7|nr:hypothetical protein [uncultured Veillonella sp.]
MNLQEYLQRIKLWIDKQYFIIRHYKIIISVFLVIIVGVLIVGVLYPHEEERVHVQPEYVNSGENNQTRLRSKELSEEISHNRQKHHNSDAIETRKDDNLKTKSEGRLLYDVSSVERGHPWKEVFKDLPDNDVHVRYEDTKDVDEVADSINDMKGFNNSKYSGRDTYKGRTNRYKKRTTQHKNKHIGGNTISDSSDDLTNNQINSKSHSRLNSSTVEQPVELVGIVEGNEIIAILRKGTEEQMVTVGTVWHGITVSNISASGIEIVEGGSSRWLRIN